MAGEVKEKSRTGMSVAALTLGIVSIVFGLFWYICIPTGILAIVFGAKTARESAMLKCSSAGHQFHCIPDVENNQKLNSVWPDCRSVMNKTLQVLKDTYTLPDCYTVPED